MSTPIMMLIVTWIVYKLINNHVVVSNTYKKVSGHKLNIQNTIYKNISSGSIPQAKSTYEEALHHRKLKSALVFEEYTMNLLLYGKHIKPYLIRIPYSHIKHYYYKVDEIDTSRSSYYTIDLYITLKQGSIVASGILLNKNHAFHYLHILESKTTKDQQVKPTYNHLIFKHPIMHGRFIDNLMTEHQTSADEQQRNKMQHQIAQDEDKMITSKN